MFITVKKQQVMQSFEDITQNEIKLDAGM